jgi:hypothetical protein
LESFRIKENLLLKDHNKQSLRSLLTEFNRIVLLGDAGSGKSTELLHLYHQLQEADSPYIPIFQNLNLYTPEASLEAFLPKNWETLPEETLVIIWDGLDEIIPEHFNSVVRQINAFSIKFDKLKIIVSSRTNFYELPNNNSPGTLIGFAPHLISNLTINNIKSYFSTKVTSSTGDEFITEIWKRKLIDLAERPFFLLLLCSYYAKEAKLPENRRTLYEMYITTRFEIDEAHFKGIYDIRPKRQNINKTLQKLALAMEMLSKNFISENEILAICTADEFNQLKYYTTFKLKDGTNDVWQFEHNNIQEYFAAYLLSNLEYESVINLITFSSDHTKIIPTWINTLAFLFSLLNPQTSFFTRLLKWFLDNEKELIVKFERGKIPDNIRNEIFWGIFNYYKERDLWMTSNKFSDSDLAEFGQSDENIELILDEIKGINTINVKINSLQILAYFNVNGRFKKLTKDILLNQIKENVDSIDYLHFCIRGLYSLEITDSDTIKNVMNYLGLRKNGSIRSSIYHLLHESEVINEYVDYVIEGYKIKISKEKDDRSDMSYASEEWNLKNCLKSITSPEALIKLLEYFLPNKDFLHSYRRDEILSILIENAIQVYDSNHIIFNLIFKWFVETIHRFQLDDTEIAIKFFDETNTRELALSQLLELQPAKPDDRMLAIAKLANKNLIHKLIELYKNHDFTNEHIENIYWDMGWIKNPDRDYFESLIAEQTSVKLKKPAQVDHDAIRIKKLAEEFNTLFNPQKLVKETTQIFYGEQKEILNFNDLFEISRGRHKGKEMEMIYSGLSLRLLRGFNKEREDVKLSQVLNWFKKKERVTCFRIQLIYEYLTNYKEIKVTQSQKRWIYTWTLQNIIKIDFKKAITREGEKTSIKTLAVYCWYFLRRFNIKVAEKYYLDLISFDCVEGHSHEYIGINYLKSHINPNKMQQRVVENLEDGIPYFPVLENHVEYILQNKIQETYPLIFKEILNIGWKEYERKNLVSTFYEKTNDYEALKTILPQATIEIQWQIIEYLMLADDKTYVLDYLLNILKKSRKREIRLRAAEYLIKMQNKAGMKYVTQLIKDNPTFFVDDSLVTALRGIKVKDALPYLNELLDVSYQHKVPTAYFNDFNSVLNDVYYNIAMESQRNFDAVTETLNKYVIEKSAVYEKAKYLLHLIDRLSNQFYLNRAKEVDIKYVKTKLMELFPNQ